jgi:hypothetical protein
MATGKLVIDTALGPTRTVGLLLNVIDELPLPPAPDGLSGVDKRWIHGVTWNPNPTRNPTVAAVDTCSPADFTDPSYGCITAVSQNAFQMYDAFSSPVLNFDDSDLDEKVLGRFANWSSWAFARELLSGTASGGLAFRTSAHAPTGVAFTSAATPIWNALAILETELARTIHNGRGIIHMPPGLLGQAAETYELEVDPATGQYVTPLGNLVVADGGYVSSPAPTGGTASGVAEDWVYASGPVWYRATGPLLIGEESYEWINLSRDSRRRFLDSYGILVFDPAPVTAVLASYKVN